MSLAPIASTLWVVAVWALIAAVGVAALIFEVVWSDSTESILKKSVAVLVVVFITALSGSVVLWAFTILEAWL